MALPVDYAITSLLRKPSRTILSIVSCALAALLVLGSLSFSEALELSFTRMGRDDVAIVLSTSAEGDPLRSEIPPAVASEVAAVRGVKRENGAPILSAEVTMGVDVVLERDATPRPALLRGVTDAAFALHPELTVIEGRSPREGEAIAGRFAERRLGVPDGTLAIGSRFSVDGRSFEVSGRFAAPGSALEAELWLSRDALMSAARRDSYSCVFVRLEAPSQFGHLQLFTQRRLDLELKAARTTDFYASLASFFGPIRGLAFAMASLIAIAAFLTSVTTLSAVVRERAVEIATLRSIGFSGGSILRSFLLEAGTIGAAGALLGCVIARFALENASIGVAMGAVALDLSSRTLATGFLFVASLSPISVVPAVFARLRRDVAFELRQD